MKESDLQTLESPFPYIIGVEPNPDIDFQILETEVLIVELDTSEIKIPVSVMQES